MASGRSAKSETPGPPGPPGPRNLDPCPQQAASLRLGCLDSQIDCLLMERWLPCDRIEHCFALCPPRGVFWTGGRPRMRSVPLPRRAQVRRAGACGTSTARARARVGGRKARPRGCLSRCGHGEAHELMTAVYELTGCARAGGRGCCTGARGGLRPAPGLRRSGPNAPQASQQCQKRPLEISPGRSGSKRGRMTR